MAKSDEKVFTAPLCTIQVGTTIIAQIQNISFSEQIDRARVKGMGNLIYTEFPSLSISCSGSFTFNSVKFRTDGIPTSLVRAVGSLQEFVDTLTLGELPISINIFRRKENSKDAKTGIVKGGYEEFATIKDFHLESESFDIANESIGQKTQTFVYSTPILYSL